MSGFMLKVYMVLEQNTTWSRSLIISTKHKGLALYNYVFVLSIRWTMCRRGPNPVSSQKPTFLPHISFEVTNPRFDGQGNLNDKHFSLQQN